jgi:hypothetical protein
MKKTNTILIEHLNNSCYLTTPLTAQLNDI